MKIRCKQVNSTRSQIRKKTSYLNLIHVAYRMIKFDRAAAFHVCLVSSIAIHCLPRRSRGECVACMRCISRSIALRQSPSLLRPSVFETGCVLSGCLNEKACAILDRCAESRFGTLNTMLWSLIPLCATLLEHRLASCRRSMAFGLLIATTCDRLNCGAHGRCNSDSVGIISSATFDAIAWRQECVESLDEVRMSCKQFRNAIDDAWCIDTKKVNISTSSVCS